MMEKEYIEKLLESYMAAETTEEEEQLLSDYFRTNHDIPAEWRNYSVLFRGISQYEQKANTSSMRTIQKWSVAAAVMIFVFGAGAMLMHQEETSKPSDAVAQIVIEEPAINAMDSKQETIMKEKPVAVEKKRTSLAKSARCVEIDKPTKKKKHQQEEKEIQHINKMLDDADMAFSMATVQCSMNIDESFLQEEKKEETDDETNIFL